MGSGKKKEKKKKKKRTRDSDDGNSPDRTNQNFSVDEYPSLEEYYQSQKSRSDYWSERSSYEVEDVRSSKSKNKDNSSYDKYTDSYYKENQNQNWDSYNDVPQTEEYVYDYSGQEIVKGSRDMSVSPERTVDRNDYKIQLTSRNKEIYNEDTKSDYDRKNDKDRTYPLLEHRDRSRSPIRRERRKELTPPPPPPGMDWPFEAPSAQKRQRSPVDDTESDWKQKDDQKRDREYQDEVDRKYQIKQREDNRKIERVAATSSNNDESLSIEETNKLRAKLGLKPLKVDSDTTGAAAEKSYADREDVHKPATNIAEKKSAVKMREKMEAIREKRRINQKLQRVKGLGAEDDPVLDSAAAWVAKSRIQEKEKAMAAKRAQMLEEMDEEFGISDLIEETVGKMKREPTYSSKDLRGLRVQHKGAAFEEGRNVILTLEDKGILDEDNEDVLMNVNIIDEEKAKKNIENRRKKPGYKAYDEVDDETGMLKVCGVLDKYDEEIDGTKKASFKLDGSGKADLDGEDTLDKIRATLKAQQVTLEMAAPQLARDYFTEEEMVKFKKPRKKVRKVRKREVLKADDLLRLNMDSRQDRGSRKNKSSLKNSSSNGVEEDMDIVPTAPDELDYFVAVNLHGEVQLPLVEDDEAEQELQLALQRSRRTKQKKGNEEDEPDAALEKMANEILSKPKQQQLETEQQMGRSRKRGRGMIVLDSTSEFCRTLGELPPTLGPAPPTTEEHISDEEMILDDDTKTTIGSWAQVEINKGKGEVIDTVEEVKMIKTEEEDVLESEPIPTSLAATLNLAGMKGYLKEGKQKVRKFDPLNLPETKAEVDVEKLRDEEKSKYNRGGYERDRDRYDPYAFKEKSNYKPDIKLEYVDNKGRQLNRKEAFRLLSHKFHGKGSGKLKTEKRAKKLLDEKKLQMMSSIDTPLNTAAMFKDKQKQTQSPYLVLSGGGKNLLSGETLKK